jgi:hypothetical protein
MDGGVTPQYLALLASQYVRAAERGQANINDYLADLVGRPVGTVRGHLIRARRDGLLTGSHGKKGGQLSDDAKALVEPFARSWLDEYDKLFRASPLDGFFQSLASDEVEMPPRVVEDKPKRRRPHKEIKQRTET